MRCGAGSLTLCKSFALTVWLSLMTVTAWPAQFSEDTYNQDWCEHMTGVHKLNAEFVLPSRQRVDCFDKRRQIAWEMDFGRKHNECVGQALTYSRQTGFRAGCVLIIEKLSECFYYERLWEDALVLHSHGIPFRIATTPFSCDRAPLGG